MSEWVTGQPAVSGYFLKLFYPLSLLLIAYSQIFLIFSGGSLLAALCKAAAFEKPTCRNAAAPQLTVSCLVEERGAAVERAPLRAA